MTHPPAGPSSPSPAPGPGRDEQPLDPRSPEGRAVAVRLTRTLALIELEIAARETVEGVKAA